MFPVSENMFRLLEMTDLPTVAAKPLPISVVTLPTKTATVLPTKTVKPLPTVTATALPISVVNASPSGDGGRRSYLVLAIEQS